MVVPAPASSAFGETYMTNSDQQMIQQAAATALDCLARALKAEAAGSPRWLLLVEALGAVEAIEAVANEASDGFAPAPSFNAPSDVMRPQRLTLARSLLCRPELPERQRAA